MEVVSEIAKLQQVILHQPTLALRRLTPENCHKFLFDDVLWVRRAEEEHNHFMTVLRHNNVTVLLLHELLTETLEIPAARNWLLTKRLMQLHHQSDLVNELGHYLNEKNCENLAQILLDGLTLQESGLPSSTLLTKSMHPHDFLLPPLPNHLFTRDSSCWIGGGVAISKMAYAVRRGESLNIEAIYKFHPMFASNSFPIWLNGSQDMNLPKIEGGDILVVNKDILLVGLSERTAADSIELLAKVLFAAGEKKLILVLELPKVRATMHLDTMMTLVSYDMVAIAFLNQHKLRAWSIRPGSSAEKLVVEPVEDFFSEFARALEVNKLHLVTSKSDYFSAQREQWNDSANLLAISPGEVIAYNRNTAMNDMLRKAGVTVHEIPSSELSRGRGGPRCMSCPIKREVR